MIQSLCVFCGSSAGGRDEFRLSSEALADVLLAQNIQLVYGGAHVGLMGAVADRMLAGGGTVIGVIPQALVDIEVAHESLSELHVVSDMHSRKAMMANRSDAFVALPGGLGTLEELFEVLTWAQLGIHQKAVGLLNVDGFYDDLLRFLDRSMTDGFMRPAHRQLLKTSGDPADLLEQLNTNSPEPISKLS